VDGVGPGSGQGQCPVPLLYLGHGVSARRVAARYREARRGQTTWYADWWMRYVMDAQGSLASGADPVEVVVAVEAKLMGWAEAYRVKFPRWVPMLDTMEDADGDPDVAEELLNTVSYMAPSRGSEQTYVVFGNAEPLPDTPFLRAHAVHEYPDGTMDPLGVGSDVLDHVAAGRMQVWKVRGKAVGEDGDGAPLVTDTRMLEPIPCEAIGLECQEAGDWDLGVDASELNLIVWRGLRVLRQWFKGDWMAKGSVKASDVDALKLLARLAPSPRRTKLYRVIGIWSKHECEWFETATNARIQTSNKRVQSWARSMKAAQTFYTNVKTMGRDEAPTPRGRGDGTAVWLIVEAEVPARNVILDYRSILAALKRLDAYFAATGDLQSWGKVTRAIRFLDTDWYHAQQEVVVYLASKKATANRFHVLSCEE